MNNSKMTRRALFTSVVAIFVCITMLIGTTFAWFTDTASTAVNKIQAGTLDIELQYQKADGTWEDAEGKTLDFKKPSGHENESILWEPGCTYELPALRVVNKGNLALKYKVAITGINGDATLNEVIDWTINDAPINLVEMRLAANTPDSAFVIKGHMQETAGNEYQGLTIDGIAITVVATQYTNEYDGFNNNYDYEAEYPISVAANVNVVNNQVTEAVTFESTQKVGTTNTPVAKVTVPSGAAVVDGTEQLELTVDEVSTPSNFVASIGTDTKTFEVDMKGLDKANNTELFKVELYVGAGLGAFKLYHNGTEMTKTYSLSDLTQDQQYYYNSSTGVVTFLTSTFSPFTGTYDKDSWANNTAESYATPVNTTDKIVTIASAEELALFAKEVNSGNSYAGYTVNLTEDVDLSQYAWNPIGQSGKPFNGIFNGNNHVISNLFIKGTQANSSANNYHGLFGNLNTPAVVKDFTINNATVNGSLYVGAVAGMAYTGKEISGITLTGDIKITGYWYVGGIAGNGYINEVKNCTVNANEGSYVKGTGSYIGGIFGFRGEGGQKITDCVSNIDVIGYSYVGGISGMLHYGNTISGCTSTGTVTKTAPRDTTDLSDLYGIGGIAGISVDNNTDKCLIKDCTFSGELISNSEIVNQGVIGYNRDGVAANNLTITNCTVNGTLVNIPEAE